MRRVFGLLAMLLVLGGCGMAPIPFAPNPKVAVERGMRRERLLVGDWRQALPAGRWRQSALFEWHGRKLPMVGLLQLDQRRQSLKLLALDDLGTKLFLLQLGPAGEELQVYQPALQGFAGFEDLLVSALRRLYPGGTIAANTRMELGEDAWLLRAPEGAVTAWFRFSGPQPLLTSWGGEGWQVDCYQLRRHRGQIWPEGMVLNDRKRGYRLLLRNEEFTADER
ncbi:hypothetical protein C2E25_06235 [Geothermobacter hydrogeniphilus]|uniref:Outer-membrane lipoprotein LolB n=1 Tax=Geothermobacter hydrogeniphilus TaxID=1969733 RepID=A0A2K2HBM0_9BACT|nr:DUF3261 domain-containing protein [Geothermobacter hydrogeniphilus]PNU20640.1 hypothetical protein C2E25_06235 [Geothermobacter hydrogeniphilus]